MSEDPISIAYSITDNWSQHVAVALTSVITNNPGESFVFHILHRGVTAANQARFARIAREHPNVTILFHALDAARFSKMPLPPSIAQLPLEAYFRLLLPELLAGERRTIYSDVDVLTVRGGIRELWETDLRGNPLAAVSDHHIDSESFRGLRKLLGLKPEDEYFCAGLMVMDLERMRREHYVRTFFETAERLHAVIRYVDQDVANAVCAGKCTILPDKWNCADSWSPFRRDVVQWHFQCQTAKPWCNIWKCTTWMPYVRYLLKTPYRANAFAFLWGHVRGFFFFAYTKNCVRRYLVCGLRVWKRKVR